MQKFLLCINESSDFGALGLNIAWTSRCNVAVSEKGLTIPAFLRILQI